MKKEKMNDEQIKKMQEGREKAKKVTAELTGVVCRFKDRKNEYEISSTPYQYSLMINGSDDTKTYFPSIESALMELLEQKEKKLMIKSKEKDLLSVRQAVLDARKWMKRVVHPLIGTEHHDKKSMDI